MCFHVWVSIVSEDGWGKFRCIDRQIAMFLHSFDMVELQFRVGRLYLGYILVNISSSIDDANEGMP